MCEKLYQNPTVAALWAYIFPLCLDDGQARTSLRQIGEDLGLSPRQVSYALTKIERANWCSHVDQGRDGIVIKVLLPGAQPMGGGLASAQIIPEAEKPTEKPESPAPKKEPRKREKYFLTLREAQEFVYNATENQNVRDAACEWVRMRYAKKGEHRLTEKAILGAFQKMRDMGYNNEDEAVACLMQSVGFLWDGVFPLKE